MLEIAILTLSTLVSAAIGLFVYARNPTHLVNRLYGGLALVLTLFPVANYFSLHTADRLFYIRAVLFLTVLLVALLYYLVFFLDGPKKKLSVRQIIGIYYTLVVAVLCFTPWVFSGLTSGDNPTPVPNLGAALFFLQLVVFLAYTFVLLIKRIRTTTGIQHQQYVHMLVGITPMFVFSPITGFLLPVVFQDVGFIFLSPLYTAFFVYVIGYTMIKHQLFDIRFFVVRSVAYLATLLVLAAGFGIVVFTSLRLITNVELSLAARVYISSATALAALVFSGLKSFFDRISNSLFYKDAYDSQVLLDSLNNLFVQHTDLEHLLKQSATVLERSLKLEFCLFAMQETNQMPKRFIGNGLRTISPKDMTAIGKMLASLRRKIVVADELGSGDEVLRDTLRRYDVSLLCRLTPNVKQSDAGFGYLVLGARRSGNPFTAKDIRTLELIGNQLVIAIESSLRFEQIQHFNETLQENINTATHKLRQTNEKLQNLDITKDEFITMASHQLRTPLTAVKGYLSMVLEGDAGKLNINQRKLLEQSFNSSQRMVYLIADLLNLSRLSTGKFVIESTPTNLAEVVEAEVTQLAETAKSREVGLHYSKPSTFPELMLDETKIRQVVMNFIDNAIYYTPPGGEITIELHDTPRNIEYIVTDTGIGVPKAEQFHLFSKFYRADNARRARPDGTGLGLFMAKKVVAAQGGAIVFQSVEGKGSTFGFRFDKQTHQVPPTPAPKK